MPQTITNNAPLIDQSFPQRAKNSCIQPREDEGKEQLPQYSTSISLTSLFQRKMEFDGPGQRAVDRNWTRVLVTLQGTSFRVYKTAPTKFFGSSSAERTCSVYLIRSYNLQYAQVGVAADYVKKQYVMRIRAETDQFLLSCLKIDTLVTWIQSLGAAIDLAPSLDEREYPEDLSIPRRQRLRRVSQPVIMDAPDNSDTSRASSRSSTPRRNLGFRSRSRSSSRSNSRSSSLSRPSTNNCDVQSISNLEPIPSETVAPTLPPPIVSLAPSYARNLTSRSSCDQEGVDRNMNNSSNQRRTLALIPRLPYLSQRVEPSPFSNNSTNETPDGKWRPCDQSWSDFYDIAYAIRCLSILTSYTPRRSNILVADEEFWVVDWVTGVMTRLCDGATRASHMSVTSKSQSHAKHGAEFLPKYEDLLENGYGLRAHSNQVLVQI